MNNIIQPIKGTRDFYPKEMAARSWLYSQVRYISESFGYQEYEGPLLESIDLYAAKSGEELVKEQSFVFPDRSGELITLRPELTPTLARMVAQRQRQLIYPLRWWSFGPFWRYERPQKGRTREFFQWNIDLIGMNSPAADAEIISIVAAFLKRVGLTSDKAKIFVNDRQLIEKELKKLHIKHDDFNKLFHLIDRKEKLRSEEWLEYGQNMGFSRNTLTDLTNVLADKELWKNSENLQIIFNMLKSAGFEKYFLYDPSVVRGLDYYTGTVFEAKDISGNINRSLLGGGRYDNLLADVGGDPLPAVGFAMGDVVAMIILDQANCLPADIGENKADVFVTVFDTSTIEYSIEFAMKLRNVGIKTICHPEASNLSKQFKYANRINAKLVVVIGPDELLNRTITVKNLLKGDQTQFPENEAIKSLAHMLEIASS